MKKIYKKFYKKKFGQVFLTDTIIIKKIIKTFNPKPNQFIVEIGSGLGSITFPIIQKTKQKLTAIEIDKSIIKKMKKKSFIYHDKINLINEDARKINYKKLSKKKLRIIGNLPYNISTQILFHLFKYIHNIKDMYFTLQKEVADRLTAKKDTKDYNHLSIISQYYCNIKIILSIPPTSFFPIPKVKSSFIKLTPKKNIFKKNFIKSLIFITKKAFNKRRKILSNCLKEIFTYQELLDLKINPKDRPENLSIKNYCKLAKKIIKNSKNNLDKI